MKQRACFALFLVFLISELAYAAIIYRGTDPKQLALTFDDGPTPGVTEKILLILKQEKVPATFFVVGRKIPGNEQLIKAIADQGHEIGNHTYYHSRVSWVNDEKLRDELQRTSQLIKAITGSKVTLFRPPHGRLTGSKRRVIEQAGYDLIMWSINADDFYHAGSGIRKPVSITRRVVSAVRGGDIILMHDNSRQIVEALPLIIKTLKKQGYHFTTVSRLRETGAI